VNFNDLNFLSKLSSVVQVLAIVLIFLGGVLQASRFFLDYKIDKIKNDQASGLQTTISEQAQKIKRQSTELEQTKSLTGDLNKKSSRLESELAESKSELTDLQKKTAPRNLRPEQKRKLAQLLPTTTTYKIAGVCRLMDNESCNYVEELIAVFRDLRWRTGNTNKTLLDDIKSDVVVTITEDAQIPVADQILKALNAVGIKANNEAIRKEAITGIQEDAIYLIVGARKQKP